MGQRAKELLGGVSWDLVESAIPQAGTRAGAALFQDILRIPDAETSAGADLFSGGVYFGELNSVSQGVALELLGEGWLEARHDGGVLEPAIFDASARLIPGWRFEACVRERYAASLSGLQVREADVVLEDLVLSTSEVENLSLLGAKWLGKSKSVAVLIGASGAGKTVRAEAVAALAGKKILEPSVGSLMDPRRTVLSNIKVLEGVIRETGAMVLIEHSERFFPRSFPPPAYCEAWYLFLKTTRSLVVLTARWPELVDQGVADGADWVHAIAQPRLSDRRSLWEKTVAPSVAGERPDYDRLARRFSLNAGAIQRAVSMANRAAQGRAAGKEVSITQADLEAGASLQVRHGLDKLAEKVVTNLSLEDLIVSAEVQGQIAAIVDAAKVREVVFDDWGFAEKQPRGRGLSMLFDGEPGTGKTLCAEILSAELQQPLYRVSMANILSKWVGETEKNLERIFSEAQGSRTILLFDEADALFSKRVEVQQANDRFANLEVNALLQLMESHDGICVLTTNLKSGIDKAFERRLSFRVHFPFPEADTRARLWAHHLPEAAPVDDDVDAELLAEAFELSGGSIRNAAVRAAYRAAARGGAIHQSDLVEGAKAECVATGKLYRVMQDDD